MLRLFVMGTDAWERAATDDERAQIASVLDESVAAGAFGFSTSFFDADAQSRPVPSRLADADELDALVEVLGRHGRGLIEFIPDLQAPGGEQQLIDLVELCGRYGVVSTTNTLVASGLPPAVRSRDHGAHPQAARRRERRSGPRCRRAPSTSASTGRRRWCS